MTFSGLFAAINTEYKSLNMPNINLNGQTVKVDNGTAQKITNLAKEPKIKAIAKEFWTDRKLGKHDELVGDYVSILEKTLLIDPDEFRADLFKSTLKPGKMADKLTALLADTPLRDDLKKEYITMCLGVTTTRPAIGKGEFLFAATFKNIGFSSNVGDLVDLDTGSKIEVKGIGAPLGNGQNKAFKPMTARLMKDICRELQIDDMKDWALNQENAYKIKKALGLNEKKAMQIFTYLQNLWKEDNGVSRAATKLYFDKGQLIRTVAAMHLYCYMKVEQNDYLLIVNDDEFRMFNAPQDLYEAYDIISKMSINAWREGEYGIKVTLR